MIKFFTGDNPERKIERLIAQGERLFQHGKEREGIEKFAEAADILPEASKPSLYLGRAYFKRKDYDLALKHYYKGLYFCEITEEPKILCEIAQVYLSMQRYDIAEEKLKKALRLEPQFTLAIMGLTHIYLQIGRVSEALEQQEILGQLFPEDVQTLQKLADIHRYLGEYRETRKVLQQAIELAYVSSRRTDIEAIEFKMREVSFPDGREFGMKEYLYARYGSICIGTANDNGLELHAAHREEPSATELRVTLSRLVRLIQKFSWNITCIVACDKNSEPLSLVIAALLGVSVKSMTKVSKTDRVLICQFYQREAKQIKKVLKKIERRTHFAITFAFMAQVSAEENTSIPDILGIPIEKGMKSVWKNAHNLLSRPHHATEFFGTPYVTSETSVQRFLDEYSEFPEEENIDQQIAYYADNMTLLRSHLVPSSETKDSLTSYSEKIAYDDIMPGLLANNPNELYATLKRIHAEHLQVQEIFAALKSLYVECQETRIRRLIGKHLLDIEQDAGLSYLLSLFYASDTDILCKIALIDTLSRSSHRQVSQVIFSALQHTDEQLRRHAIRYLDKLDRSQPLSDLYKALLNDVPEIIVYTIHHLSVQQSPILWKFLPDLLQHVSADVLHATLDALQMLNGHNLTPLVLKLLSHRDQSIAAHAITTLGRIGDIDSGYHLLPFLEHRNPELRYAAVASLTKLEHQRSIVFLMERLRKETPDVQEKLLTLFGEVGSQETVPFIVQFAEQSLDQPNIVSAAMRTLARLKNPRSLPFVRKVAAKFADQEILVEYISIIAAVGEEKDIENLITFLAHSAVIQFRVAAVLYKKGYAPYFTILQDGIRSKKIPINLLAIEALAEIDDETSKHVLLTAFNKELPAIDKKIVDMLYRHKIPIDSTQMSQNARMPEFAVIIDGIQRAIRAARSLEEVEHGIDVLYACLHVDAIPLIQHLTSPENTSLIQCGALRWLALHDPMGNSELIQRRLDDENIEVANTAYLLLEEMNQVIV